MKNNKPTRRPVFLNLLLIRQPVTAIASIAHRISGVLLVAAIPYVIWLLDCSLQSEQGYAEVAARLHGPFHTLLLLLLGWALAHHACAGIRFLLLDIDLGINLNAARKSAAFVLGGGVLGLILTAVVVL